MINSPETASATPNVHHAVVANTNLHHKTAAAATTNLHHKTSAAAETMKLPHHPANVNSQVTEKPGYQRD